MTDPTQETKWILFSRRLWGRILTAVGTAGLLLSMATPETVTALMTPFLEFCAALGWEPSPDLRDRALRATLALAGIVGVISALRSRMAPDARRSTYLPTLSEKESQ